MPKQTERLEEQLEQKHRPKSELVEGLKMLIPLIPVYGDVYFCSLIERLPKAGWKFKLFFQAGGIAMKYATYFVVADTFFSPYFK